MASTRSLRGTSNKSQALLNNASKEGSRCGHILSVLSPLVGGGLVILVLVQLLTKLQISPKDQTISDALAAYEPYNMILVPAIIGASIMFIVTIVRNIQIKVYYTRAKTYSKALTVLNFVSALFNILAYVGFIILALFRAGGAGIEGSLHGLGTVLYFVSIVVYGILQSYLLWRQTQYPLLVKILFVLIAGAAVVCTLIFGATRFPEYEWAAVALAAVYIMLFAVLFHIDPVEDELASCFCCRFQRVEI